MNNIDFLHPEFFYLLIVIPLIVAWYIWKQKGMQASLQISSLKGFSQAPVSKKIYLRHLVFVFRMLAIAALIVVLARPQSSNSMQNVTTEGIDIVMALDISSSMRAEDFKPNRLEAAKNVAVQFISGRENDKIGLVVFAAESFTQCPLTTDRTVLTNLFKDIYIGMLEDGTAIGMGLATSVARLKDSQAKSKVVILLTDGVNNQGEIAPLTAAEIAQTFGIRVYTVGVGTIGQAPYPMETVFGKKYQNVDVKIDEELLKQIAEMTDGMYFRATDNNKLAAIYEEIDKLEKTKIEVKEYTKRSEEYLPFAILAGLLLLVEVLLRNTVLRNLP
jgi:Ca-activated chloride channel family protein